MVDHKTDFLIVGAGVIGLSLAAKLKQRQPNAKIIVIDKERAQAEHSSGRNSGVLHAGFYYTADSLKARFTVAGNRAWREFCEARGLPINKCGKLVVAQNEAELEQLSELERRGIRNGAQVRIIEEAEAREFEPNVRTFRKALYSPNTATIDPIAVCRTLREELERDGVLFIFDCSFSHLQGEVALTSQASIETRRLINCAGLYADQIARDCGIGHEFTIIPFKGLYLKYAKNKDDVRMHIYPVPNLRNPFLGVHFTKTVDGTIKIGPTAIPAFWRENYGGFSRFKLAELLQIGFFESKLFLTNAFNFRSLAFEEMHKYSRSHFIELAAALVQSIDAHGFGEYTRPGIRAQLLDKRTLSLVQDFVVQRDKLGHVHVLNAVSPGLTCSFPFAEYIIDNYL